MYDVEFGREFADADGDGPSDDSMSDDRKRRLKRDWRWFEARDELARRRLSAPKAKL